MQCNGPIMANAQKKMPDNFVIDGFFRLFFVLCSLKFGVKRLPREHGDQGPDHVQVFWKHKSIENQASDWLTP